MTTSTVVKKDIQKLQRAIVDGLEDVKAQDIQVFDTEHLSALFERVIIASGTSNRQTKALAASVRDAVREAGFDKPRLEGEGNGEWIIVDCGQAVVHVMQPTFRQYYHLEELWGDKPVRLKLGAVKPNKPEVVKTVPTKAATQAEPNLRRSNAAKKGVAEAFPSKAQLKKAEAGKTVAKKAPVKRVAAKKTVGTAAATPVVKKVIVKAPTKTVAAKTAVKSSPSKSAAAKKASAKKPAARKV
ncbi:MAG: ribosome silencing factor [Candidatus Saccharibacteria bacterium]|nr:ribosome silencing factor [Rhodoferax sp.]